MEAKFKHLDYVQAVISRMANNQFLFKGWAITVAAGLSAFGAANARPALLLIALASILLFWGLDGYYLWLEHGFRRLYDEVAAAAPGDINFAMCIDKKQAAVHWFRTCWRPHLLFFYGVISIVDSLGIILATKG